MGKAYELGWQLGGRAVITTSGEELGKLDDIVFDEKTGKFLSLIVDPAEGVTADYPKDKDGKLIVPFEQVNAIGTVVVVKD